MSFFEDLIGSFAEAGAKGLNDISARNQREAELKLQNDLAIERAKAAEEIRLDLEERQRQAKQQRLSQQRQEVEAAAPAATQARELGQAQKMAPSVDGNVLDIIKSKLTPAQMQKFYGVDQGPVAELDDKLGVARDKGLYDAEAVLQVERKDTVAAIKAARKEALDQQKADGFDERTAAMIKVGAGHDAARVAAKSAGAAGGGEGKLSLQQAREKRVDLKDQIATLMKEVELGLTKKDAAKPLIESLKAQQNKYDKIIADGEGAAAPTPKPAPAPKPAAAAPAANTPGWSIKKK